MKNVAVVCALPPERNTGMATVDLAAYAIIPTLVPDTNVTFYSYGKVGEYAYQEGELPFHYVDLTDRPEEYLNSDLIIFWGDFIHSRSYWEKDRGDWDKAATSGSLEKRREEYGKYIFLSTLSEEALKKAIIFGSTIITNSAGDMLDDFYRSNMERLLEHAGGVFFRDALSAAKASPYRGLQASLACDCALLLEEDHHRDLPGYVKPSERSGVGVYFGRTGSRLSMLCFAKVLARQLGEKDSWIPWLHTRRRWRLIARLFGYEVAETDVAPGVLLTQLGGYSYIVTDTYHLCVNAWRLGIPAVCIGKGSAVSEHSLADKKKEILFEMYGAREFYIFVENLRSFFGFSKSITQAKAALRNNRLSGEVSATIKRHVQTARLRLIATINTILSR